MGNKNGFTLVELLAVIVILAIILAVAIPGIGLLINNSKVSSYNSQMALIQRAASLYMAQYGDDNSSVNLDQLKAKNLISSNITNPITNQPFDNIVVNVSQNNGTTVYETYEGPTLVTGMIPVYYDDVAGKWKKADKSNANNNWYDYNNQNWANAVTVTTSSRETTYQNVGVGDIIEMTDINAMFVWIPRYKYLIPAGDDGVAREISVVFETKYTPKSTGNAVTSYYTHPAFTFGNEELNGIWVGKFETTGDKTAPTIKPNAQSLRSLSVKGMYDSVKKYMQGNTTYGFSNDNDTHMMKNMEWGAAAYLTQSRYGKYGNTSYDSSHKELYMNNSTSHFTGRSMGAAGGDGKTTTLYDGTTLREDAPDGYYTYDGKCATINTALPQCAEGTAKITPLTDKTYAYGASTTGTIYGIYDMSGGSREYVMGVYEPNPIPTTGISDYSGYSTSTTNSQYDLLNLNAKYYNRYLGNVIATNAILGDATKEVSGWYGDEASFVNSSKPWLYRSGFHMDGPKAGTWSFSASPGGDDTDFSYRVIVSPQA